MKKCKTMSLPKAVKKAIKKDGYITMSTGVFSRQVFIKPTNTADACIVYFSNSSRRGWQPNANDLISKDWEVISQKEMSALLGRSKVQLKNDKI